MHRSLLSFLFFTCLALASSAQWHGGPLTIIASPAAQHPHPSFIDDRGGPPPNDLCQNAVITALPPNGSATVTGNNTGATDTENFGNPNCWEAFTIDTCSTVTVSYCGTSPVFGLVYSILLIGCPVPEVSVQNSGTATCADGNMTVTYANLPAGTYYVPVLLWPGQSQGPYMITFSSQVCDLPPVNERCIDAITIPVVVDCADGTVAGNNALAVQNGADPPCAPSSSPIQDVWYTFNSGMNDQVLITLGLGTIGDVGVQVLTACGGTTVACGTGDTDYQVNVTPNTNYKVRVFSNNAFGLGGSFTICVTVPPPVNECDGGHVSLMNGDTAIMACTVDPPISITYSTSSSASYTFALANANDTIVQMLPGTEVDLSGLVPGVYHIWGISHLSTLQGDGPGLPVSGIHSIGVCAELSTNFIELVLDICQSTAVASSMSSTWILDGSAPALVWRGGAERVQIELYDVRGALVSTEQISLAQGQHHPLQGADGLPGGMYAVRVVEGTRMEVRRVLIR